MENIPWKMPEKCVAERCSNVADPKKNISMNKIPFFGEECPIKKKRRKRWINFVLFKFGCELLLFSSLHMYKWAVFWSLSGHAFSFFFSVG